MDSEIFSVGEVTRYIKSLFENDEILTEISVRGEISNFKCHNSGHFYFSLKDEEAQIRCVMFKSRNTNLNFTPQNGQKVIATGYITVYEKNGEYQLYVETLEKDGIGELFLQFQKLKEKLQEEGLFDDSRKKNLPFLPQNIGIVTSINGAALRDLLTVIKRRFPNVNIIIVPVSVQGEQAKDEISEGIELLNIYGKVDVIIVGRGGGSIEELWAFNEEKVARAIANSKIPVISAVGHQTDFTIADFVADMRAPTPSAAGEMVIPEKEKLKGNLEIIQKRLFNRIETIINTKRQEVEYLKRYCTMRKFKSIVDSKRQDLDEILKELILCIENIIEVRKTNVKNLVEKLNDLSPIAVLKRGYSICQNEDNKIIKTIEDAYINQTIKIMLSDGIIRCSVNSKEKRVIE
ncbi:MAG: exodeoxyribonuclease VII large subunit [Thermovenabulum sp.]|uniref:exodeoxyribonuclease VII large subunit n=1 Tax=Thermovenabulum sp. TaxID=3100335 RepID=UPI003C7EBEA3